jgi:plasmid maintenance system antidote protein VapI
MWATRMSRRIDLDDGDVELLADTVGSEWVRRFLADDERHVAVAELCHAFDALRLDGDPDEVILGFPVAIEGFDWSRPPGRLLVLWGEAAGLEDTDIARSCGIELDVYRGIVTGSEPITAAVAQQLSRGTNTFPAYLWVLLEQRYRTALMAASASVRNVRSLQCDTVPSNVTDENTAGDR